MGLQFIERWTGAEASRLLLVCGGFGYLFYVLGGLLGERWGRRQVLVWTGLATGPLNFLFMLAEHPASIYIVYLLIYQITNGAWSGAGYAYWAESFPTRVRGTAIGSRGVAGNRQPEAEGVFLARDLWEARWFCSMGDVGRRLDVWQVDVRGYELEDPEPAAGSCSEPDRAAVRGPALSGRPIHERMIQSSASAAAGAGDTPP